MNWIAAMMMDARLNARDKLILTRLAMHLNLKTDRCDPSIGLLALELSIGGNDQSARRVIRRSLEKSAKLGARHFRIACQQAWIECMSVVALSREESQ